jgi:hypothetical protein
MGVDVLLVQLSDPNHLIDDVSKCPQKRNDFGCGTHFSALPE